jgi:methyl-accepting chemotaxis protein
LLSDDRVAFSGVDASIATYFAVDQIKEFVGSAIEMGASIDDTAQRLGVGTEELQQFQYAVKISGGSIEDANNALKFFSKSIGDATTGTGDAAAQFAKLGVNIRGPNGEIGDTMDLLGGVAEGFKNLKTDGERTAMAMQLFGRGGLAMVPMLKRGQEGVAELAKEFKKLGGGLDEGTIKALADADDELDRLSFSGKALKAELVAALVPAIREVVGWVTSLVGQFRELARNSYIVETAMWSLAAVAGTLALVWAALNIEVLLAVAGVALFILAVDDLYTWLQGGDSVIGEFIDALFGEGKSDELLVELSKDYDDIKTSVDDASDAVDALVKAMDDLGDATGINIDGVASTAWSALLLHIRTVAAEIKLVAQVIEWVAEKATKLTRLPGLVKDLVGGGGRPPSDRGGRASPRRGSAARRRARPSGASCRCGRTGGSWRCRLRRSRPARRWRRRRSRARCRRRGARSRARASRLR